VKLLGLTAAVLVLIQAGSSGWVTFRTDGVRIRHPADWYATTRPLTPVTSPETILSVASFAFPEDPRWNGCRPAGTLAAKQPSGAVIFVIEYGEVKSRGFTLRAFPPRPVRFKLRSFAHYECHGRSYQIRFRESGRYFQVFASFGRRATLSTRATVLRILNTFNAKPR
jgi:hypothetical protein